MNLHAHLLRAEIKKLKQGWEERFNLLATTNPVAKSYLDLEEERDKLQTQTEKLHGELKDNDGIIDGLVTENEKKEERITKLEQELAEKETELSDTENYCQKELSETEIKWTRKYQTSQKEVKTLQTNKTENENLLRTLTKERDDYQARGEKLAKSITSFLTKQSVSSIVELQAKIHGQETSLTRLVKDNGEKQQWISQQKNKLLTSYPLFGTIKDLVEQSKSVDLFKKNQKQLLERITNFEKVWEWEAKKELPKEKESKPTLTDTIKQTITGKKKPPKITAKETQWRNIDLDFTEELIREWESRNFTFEQTREWINIGLSVNDADYCAWIRDIKQLTAEWCLNNADADQLNQEYENWKQTK